MRYAEQLERLWLLLPTVPHNEGVPALVEAAADLIEELKEFQKHQGNRILILEGALYQLAGRDLYDSHMSSWHDVGHMETGVREIAQHALDWKGPVP